MAYRILLLFCLLIPLASHAQKRKIIYKTDTTHVYFGFDSADIVPSITEDLNFIIKTAKLDDSIKIYGYCDTKGSYEYNDKLAQMRVDAVKKYLVSKGVSPVKIVQIKGWGKRKPVNSNTTDYERRLNRRVDIIYTRHSTMMLAGTVSINLDSVKVGETIIMKNLNFYPGSHKLVPESLPVLDSLLSAMKKNPTVAIKIIGHVCCTHGDDGFDYDLNTWDLSWRRSEVVYEYLIKHDIPKERLSYKGMAGKIHLVEPERTEADRAKNRRVEILVVKR